MDKVVILMFVNWIWILLSLWFILCYLFGFGFDLLTSSLQPGITKSDWRNCQINSRLRIVQFYWRQKCQWVWMTIVLGIILCMFIFKTNISCICYVRKSSCLDIVFQTGPFATGKWIQTWPEEKDFEELSENSFLKYLRPQSFPCSFFLMT